MSHVLISRNPDLARLNGEGYDLEINQGHLIVKQVPYVNSMKKIVYGTLVSPLNLAGERTTDPAPHTIYFIGEHPCDASGKEIEGIRLSSEAKEIVAGITVDRMFSARPQDGYADYYHKIKTYADTLSGPALQIDSTISATPQLYSVEVADSVFEYEDTNSSRAHITALNLKFKNMKIGIVGLGGTGSYTLDFVAKTPVSEIHLFDGDQLKPSLPTISWT